MNAGPFGLWDPRKREDFNFIDDTVSEYFNIGGVGVHVHRYLGPQETNDRNTPYPDDKTFPNFLLSGDELEDVTKREDDFFGENINRKYDTDPIDLRGIYQINQADSLLTSMGLMMTNDIVNIDFHLGTMVSSLGRKLLPGDVIILLNLIDEDLLDNEKVPIPKFYQVDDAFRSNEGWSPTWYAHIWRCRCSMIQNQQEFFDILFEELKNPLTELGSGVTVEEATSTAQLDDEIDKKIYDQALCEVPRRYFEHRHLWIDPENEKLRKVPFRYGDGMPPNGAILVGKGPLFPEEAEDGEYFLNTAYTPPQLFQRCLEPTPRWTLREIDHRGTPGQHTNEVLKTFVNNNNINDINGIDVPERVSLSKIRKPKKDEL